MSCCTFIPSSSFGVCLLPLSPVCRPVAARGRRTWMLQNGCVLCCRASRRRRVVECFAHDGGRGDDHPGSSSNSNSAATTSEEKRGQRGDDDFAADHTTNVEHEPSSTPSSSSSSSSPPVSVINICRWKLCFIVRQIHKSPFFILSMWIYIGFNS